MPSLSSIMEFAEDCYGKYIDFFDAHEDEITTVVFGTTLTVGLILGSHAIIEAGEDFYKCYQQEKSLPKCLFKLLISSYDSN